MDWDVEVLITPLPVATSIYGVGFFNRCLYMSPKWRRDGAETSATGVRSQSSASPSARRVRRVETDRGGAAAATWIFLW